LRRNLKASRKHQTCLCDWGILTRPQMGDFKVATGES
jgi:hypothetical protein